MADNNLLIFAFLSVIAIAIYYFYFNGTPNAGCGWWGTCPTCPTSHEDAKQVLGQFARGCTQRLRGVVRESHATAADVQAFMTAGVNRLVIITNIVPEDFVATIYSGNASQIKAVAISSTVQNGQPRYIVMRVDGGQLGPIGTPTSDFNSAFSYLESAAQQIGPDTDNLVFYIDEDIPCVKDETGVTPIDETAAPEESAEETTPIEACCGRRD